jgi:uncharacterized protein (DUF608 family)
MELKNTYSGDNLKEIAFPIGGIGTGSVSLSGYGSLIDWEIFNRPNKNSILPFSFMTIWVKAQGEKPVTKVLQAKPAAPFSGVGDGVLRGNGAGLPHMDSCVFKGEYPFAEVEFYDKELPLKITLEAYNPFIPLNADDSGIPVAIFRAHIKNTSSKEVNFTLAANLFNAVGYLGKGGFQGDCFGKNINKFTRERNLSGISMSSQKYSGTSPRFGSMALTTPWKNITYQSYWFRGAWFDNLHKFWDEFSVTGSFKERKYGPSEKGRSDVGSIGLKASIKPGKSVVMPIYISWYFPNFEKYWGCKDCCETKPTWKNFYSTQFKDAFDVARYVAKNEERLYRESKLYHDTLFSSSVPAYVLDAISSQSSILKTTTCLRLPDGTFYGFEGCFREEGCCEGSCSHVWNYAQLLPFLFPKLERSMRDADYKYNQHPDGKMCFRIQLPLGSDKWKFREAADGQMGGILKFYRDWKICGDDKWLKKLWPKVKLALDYAWKVWDKNKDGMMEGIQHNTYDIEFHGPNTMMGTFYLGALRAGEEIARYLGDNKKADEYRSVFEKGVRNHKKLLFNGEFYIQKYDPKKAPKYQFGKGCLADHFIGQWFAHLAGLGYVLDKNDVKTALKSVFKYNWKKDFSKHANCQRIYAINDEQGLLLCTWPRGGRPAIPFPYSDEVWCGIEYQVASHLIYEGFVKEGLAVANGVRMRHDGKRRNPWNEFECGNHYARSMASYSLLTALSGFDYTAREKHISFDPRINKKDFKSFFSVDSGWGLYSQKTVGGKTAVTIDMRYGMLELAKIGVNIPSRDNVLAFVGARRVNVRLENNSIIFDKPIVITVGSSLKINIG